MDADYPAKGSKLHAETHSARDIERANSLGVQTVYDYRTTDLSTIAARFDIVYDTAATMTVSTGLSMLRESGVFVDLNPGPAKFIPAMFNRRLKVVVSSARPEILEKVADAASGGKFKIPIGEIVPLSGSIKLIAAYPKAGSQRRLSKIFADWITS